MNLRSRDLLIFEAVVSHGSVQAAAEAMGLTQSAVSRVVQRLENDLQCVLLDRAFRPIRLTRDGERALFHVRRILAAVDDMGASFQDSQTPSGEFRLGIPHALVGVLLSSDQMLGLDRFPDLRPSIVSGWSDELIAKLSDRKLEAAITIAQADKVPADGTPLTASAICVVASDHLAEHAKSLSEANTIGWALNPEGCGYRKALLLALDSFGQKPNIVLETNSLDLQLQFTKSGRALTLAPEFLRMLSDKVSGLQFVRASGLDASVAVALHHLRAETSFASVYDEIQAQTKALLH